MLLPDAKISRRSICRIRSSVSVRVPSRAVPECSLRSCLHPMIMKDESIFREEAWRYRLPDLDSDLTIEGTVYSDDFSIENVCARLNIAYRSVGTGGIKKVEKWNYQCIGCKKWYKEKMDECPICGSPMKAHRKRSSVTILSGFSFQTLYVSVINESCTKSVSLKTPFTKRST